MGASCMIHLVLDLLNFLILLGSAVQVVPLPGIPVDIHPLDRSVLINRHRASFENDSTFNKPLRRISRFLQRPWKILKGVADVVDLFYSVFA